MNIIFRCDSSLEIGTGHVKRCLTLANALKEQGAWCQFICRELKGNITEHIEQQGFTVHRLPITTQQNTKQEKWSSIKNQSEQLKHAHWLGATQSQDAKETSQILQKIQPDWLIVDHYALDYRWEKEQRSYVKNIMVIDDLADRKHDCDLLLDQNLGKQPVNYKELVPMHCQLLLGPTYALLRPEFTRWRSYSLARRKQPQLRQLLITLGGVDKNNVTGQVLDALAQVDLPDYIRIIVVMGSKAPWIDQVKRQVSQFPYNCEVLVDVDNMAEIMANSDLAIGAAGSTTWERCCLGLSTITMVLADNQKKVAETLKSFGLSLIAYSAHDLTNILSNILEQENKYNEVSLMTKKMINLVDAFGTKKVNKLLMELR